MPVFALDLTSVDPEQDLGAVRLTGEMGEFYGEAVVAQPFMLQSDGLGQSIPVQDYESVFFGPARHNDGWGTMQLLRYSSADRRWSRFGAKHGFRLLGGDGTNGAVMPTRTGTGRLTVFQPVFCETCDWVAPDVVQDALEFCPKCHAEKRGTPPDYLVRLPTMYAGKMQEIKLHYASGTDFKAQSFTSTDLDPVTGEYKTLPRIMTVDWDFPAYARKMGLYTQFDPQTYRLRRVAVTIPFNRANFPGVSSSDSVYTSGGWVLSRATAEMAVTVSRSPTDPQDAAALVSTVTLGLTSGRFDEVLEFPFGRYVREGAETLYLHVNWADPLMPRNGYVGTAAGWLTSVEMLAPLAPPPARNDVVGVGSAGRARFA